MGKKAQSNIIVGGGGVIFIILLVIITFLVANVWTSSHPYKLDNVNLGDLNIPFRSGNVDIYFDVVNNADTTLISKVEVKVLEDVNNCFREPYEKELPQIKPKSQNNRYSVSLQTSYNSNKEDECENKSFVVSLKLKDSFGKVLDEETTGRIGIE